MAIEGQGYPWWRHDMMMMMMQLTSATHFKQLSDKIGLGTCLQPEQPGEYGWENYIGAMI